MTTLDKKLAKRLYDIEYRRKNRDRILAAKREYNESPAGRAMQKRNRTRFRKWHLRYCRTEQYRKWKANYDLRHRNQSQYGEFWECMVLVEKIHKEVLRICPDKYERNKFRGIIDRMQAKQALKRSVLYGWNFNWNHVLRLAKHI